MLLRRCSRDVSNPHSLSEGNSKQSFWTPEKKTYFLIESHVVIKIIGDNLTFFSIEKQCRSPQERTGSKRNAHIYWVRGSSNCLTE